MKDDTSPATKADIHRLEAAILDLGAATKAEFKAIRAELNNIEARLERKLDDVSESLSRDIDKVLSMPIGVSKQLADQAKQHEKRIKRLERHLGLVAS